MIKYHDNNIEPQYGEDHMLLNNWDENKEYGDNEYCHVYFRIDTPSYRKQGIGFLNEEDCNAFYEEINDVMSKIGWIKNIDKKSSIDDIVKGKCGLYIHPDSLSGDVKKSDIKNIAETLENNNLFTIRWVDIYEDCFDITREEQLEHLESNKNEIRKMIFESCKTPRRNKYCYASDVLSKIGKKYELDVVGRHFRSYYCYEETREFMLNCAKELVSEGYMDAWEKNNTYYIRSLNKTELKQAKLKEL